MQQLCQAMSKQWTTATKSESELKIRAPLMRLTPAVSRGSFRLNKPLRESGCCYKGGVRPVCAFILLPPHKQATRALLLPAAAKPDHDGLPLPQAAPCCACRNPCRPLVRGGLGLSRAHLPRPRARRLAYGGHLDQLLHRLTPACRERTTWPSSTAARLRSPSLPERALAWRRSP
jgi:hypothetical protein